MKPIDIAGGGLAGLSLGVGLQSRGVPTTVWEAGNYPRHRVCGEFINGVQPETLKLLQIDDLFANASSLRSATWHFRDSQVFDLELPEPATGLSRFALDQRLASRFTELGGTLKTGERFRPQTSSQAGLVWATGRVPRKSNLIGLKMHALCLPLSADLEMHFAPGGYAGVSRVEDDRVNICALFRRKPALNAPREHLFRRYLESCGMNALAHRIEHAQIDPQSHSAVASVPTGYCRRPSDVSDQTCAIGDHFGMMGPFTGNGISLAFESAATALEPLLEYATAGKSWDETVQETLKRQYLRFNQRLLLSHSLHSLLLNPLGLRTLAVLGKLRLLPFSFFFHHLR